jgi:hypothetical protein
MPHFEGWEHGLTNAGVSASHVMAPASTYRNQPTQKPGQADTIYIEMILSVRPPTDELWFDRLAHLSS